MCEYITEVEQNAASQEESRVSFLMRRNVEKSHDKNQKQSVHGESSTSLRFVVRFMLGHIAYTPE